LSELGYIRFKDISIMQISRFTGLALPPPEPYRPGVLTD
jgi:hypothetical protein